MSSALKIYIAKLTIFLYKLHIVLLHEVMLKNFYQQCENFSNTFVREEDIINVLEKMQPNSQAGKECIDAELNVELQQILQEKFKYDSIIKK